MAKYTGVVAAACVAHLALGQIRDLNVYVLDINEDSVYQMREAIKNAFLEQLDNSVQIDVQANESLHFKYSGFDLVLNFTDEQRVDVGGAEAMWVDVYDSNGRYLARKELHRNLDRGMMNRGLDALQDRNTKQRKF